MSTENKTPQTTQGVADAAKSAYTGAADAAGKAVESAKQYGQQGVAAVGGHVDKAKEFIQTKQDEAGKAKSEKVAADKAVAADKEVAEEKKKSETEGGGGVSLMDKAKGLFK